jgi:uncharacterized protein (TIGR03437 family)
VVAPYEINGSSSASIVVTHNGNVSPTVTVPVAATAPGVFTSNASGSGQAAAVNADGTINGPNNPVPLGGFVSIYLTGEGMTSPLSADGQISSNTPPGPVAGVSVMIGGQPASTSYIGEAPDEIAGLLQINVQIPTNINPSTAVPVLVSIGGVASQNNVTLVVSAQ